MKPTSMFGLIALLLVVMIGSKSVYIVKETERAIKLRFGEVVEADIKPGLHFKIPFVNTVRKFEGRTMTLDARPQAFLTLEKKRLIVDSFIKWRIDNVEKYYTATSGDEFRAADLLSTRIETSLRNQFGERTLTEVVSGAREEVMGDVIRALSDLAQSELGIEVIDVRVKRIDLPQEVSSSVYERMRTERLRLARELRARGKELAEGIRADADRQRTVLLADAFREAETVRGEGDALAASIYAEAFQRDPEFYAFYRSLNAYRESFSGGDMFVLDPKSEFFRYLNSATGKSVTQ
ncbi:protease modulator HflC [Marinobacterium sediminicola]|uniref:Protein HflC n=1 Tax=Marinobacterium sediminicola TaxID=518898 RepID=A0ABY1S3I6_9GAMM|nr:protease modulator HflC [Marinobacterium sediminicola]ULG69886.1 protease modulator HflC [Marinobacterium sediminicola]SMR77834.1 protease FtsH subunit HflC [Marinobacterium sediminicola]